MTNRQPFTVMVVDDEPSIRRLVASLLRQDGYDLQMAGTGEEAIDMAAASPPDLVLLDVQMPGMDGFAVCRHIKENPRTRFTPVVMVTGLKDRERRIEGIRAGADDFLSKPFDAEELQARVRSLLRVKRYTDQLDSADAIILSLARTIEARDPYTQGHCERLARFSAALGERIGMSTDELAALHRGAFLHDIGKIGVPDAVLLKTGRLTPEEFRLMQRHTVIGDELCGSLLSLQPVRPIIRHHHERLDGSGYPDGLSGDDISLLTQIVSIVDTYDAITTVRPYQVSRTPDVAYAELRDEAGRGWRDRALVEEFIAMARSGVIERLASGVGTLRA